MFMGKKEIVKDEMEIEETPIKEKSFNDLTAEEKVFQVNRKVNNNEELSFEENKFVNDLNEKIKQEELEEQQKRVLIEQEKIRQEYEAADPSEKLTAEQVAKNSVKINQGSLMGKLNLFLFNRKIKKAAEKGGTLILKAYKDSSIEMVYSKNPVRFIEFFEMSEVGDEQIKHVTKITKTKHRLKGTSIPLHIIAEGVFENLNLFENTEVNLSSEYLNRLTISTFQAGVAKGMGLKTESNFLEGLLHWAPLIVLVGVVIICWFSYQQYDTMQALWTSQQIMQAQMNTLVPNLDMNSFSGAMVLR
jgi:hypothetical protein